MDRFETNSSFAKWDEIMPRLSRHPLILKYGDETLCPIDDHGFRLKNGMSPLRMLFDPEDNRPIYICIGGSTTFGWFVNEIETYPAKLGLKMNKSVLNLGMPGIDIKNSLEIVSKILLKKTNNIIFIFLFGVNEKSGFMQFNNHLEDSFEITNNLYYRLEPIFSKRIGIKKKIFRRHRGKDEEAFKEFVDGQIFETSGYIALIKKLCKAYKIPNYFFLQPHGVRFINDPSEFSREFYLRRLYDDLSKKAEIIDISAECDLGVVDYIDWQHPNPHGYEKIADVISRKIKH